MLSRTRSQDAPTKKKKQPRQEALACPFIIRDFHLSSPEVQSVIHQVLTNSLLFFNQIFSILYSNVFQLLFFFSFKLACRM